MEKIGDINTIISITSKYDINTLRQIVSHLSNQIENNLIILANLNDDKSVNFIVKSNSEKVDCASIIKRLAEATNGNGGGSKVFGQGGGKDGKDIAKILKEIKENLRNM